MHVCILYACMSYVRLCVEYLCTICVSICAEHQEPFVKQMNESPRIQYTMFRSIEIYIYRNIRSSPWLQSYRCRGAIFEFSLHCFGLHASNAWSIPPSHTISVCIMYVIFVMRLIYTPIALVLPNYSLTWVPGVELGRREWTCERCVSLSIWVTAVTSSALHVCKCGAELCNPVGKAQILNSCNW